jgi:hypothetical protein
VKQFWDEAFNAVKELEIIKHLTLHFIALLASTLFVPQLGLMFLAT